MKTQSDEKQKIRIQNGTSGSLTVVVEPSANEYALAPGTHIELAEEGGRPGNVLEVEVRDRSVAVYGRPGAKITVHRDGVELP